MQEVALPPPWQVNPETERKGARWRSHLCRPFRNEDRQGTQPFSSGSSPNPQMPRHHQCHCLFQSNSLSTISMLVLVLSLISGICCDFFLHQSLLSVVLIVTSIHHNYQIIIFIRISYREKENPYVLSIFLPPFHIPCFLSCIFGDNVFSALIALNMYLFMFSRFLFLAP